MTTTPMSTPTQASPDRGVVRTRGRRGARGAPRVVAHFTAALTLLAATLAVVSVDVATAAPAHATCSDALAGNWRNIDEDTRSVTQVTLTMTGCGDTVVCDLSGCTRGKTEYSVRTYGKCHPADCDWGTQPMTSQPGGWQRAIYGSSWATKFVWVRPYYYYGRTYLRVWVYTDYTAADGRTDYSSDVWMLR